MKKRIPFFSALVETQTYLNIVYILIAFPLSIAFFTILVTGISLSAGLLILAVGFFIFIGTLLALRGFRWLDVQLTRVFLGREIPMKENMISEKKFGDFLRKLFSSPVTWKSLVFYLLIKFPLETILWSITISFIAVTFDLLFAPLMETFWWFSDDEFNSWLIRFFGDVWVLPFLGIIWGMIALHVIRGLAWVAREINTAMLSD
jgi:hypothetical protein